MIPIPVIAIYSRKSKFTGKGESIQNQIELCKEYALKNLVVKRFMIFEDEGYSGGNTNRPKYQEMLENAMNHKFDILMCYRLDRMSRNISDFTYLVELLKENNIDFISIRESFDTSTPMGRAMMFIASIFSQLERETISERVKDNMYSLAKLGRWLGGKTPTGFISKPTEYYDDTNIKRKMYKLSPIQKELGLVKLLYDKYLELGSLSSLESWTLKNGIKTRYNKTFDKSILKFILSNPVYAIADKSIYKYFFLHDSEIADTEDKFDSTHGLMVYNKHDEKKNKTIKKDKSKWIVAVGLHHGIIPSHTWISTQNLLHKNRKKAPRTGTGKTGLITNILRCKNCGSKMRISVSRKNNKIYYYYKCLSKEKSKKEECNINNLNGKIADDLVLREITKIKYNKKNLYLHLNKMFKKLSRMSDDTLTETKLNKEIIKYQDYINNLTLQLSNIENTSAAKHIINQIEEFDKEILKLRSKQQNHSQYIKFSKNLKTELNSILNIINNIDNNIDKLDFNQKKRLINLLVTEIIWDGCTLIIRTSNS